MKSFIATTAIIFALCCGWPTSSSGTVFTLPFTDSFTGVVTRAAPTFRGTPFDTGVFVGEPFSASFVFNEDMNFPGTVVQNADGSVTYTDHFFSLHIETTLRNAFGNVFGSLTVFPDSSFTLTSRIDQGGQAVLSDFAISDAQVSFGLFGQDFNPADPFPGTFVDIDVEGRILTVTSDGGPQLSLADTGRTLSFLVFGLAALAVLRLTPKQTLIVGRPRAHAR